MKSLIQRAIAPGSHDQSSSVGLLILRLFTGGCMLIAHGWGKLTSFGELSSKFPDPIGLGSAPSLALAIFAEVVCAIAVMLGLFPPAPPRFRFSSRCSWQPSSCTAKTPFRK